MCVCVQLPAKGLPLCPPPRHSQLTPSPPFMAQGSGWAACGVCMCCVCVCVCVGWGMEVGGDISELILGSLFIGGDTGDAVCTEQAWDLCLWSKSALVSGQSQCEEVRVDTFLSICQSLSRTCSIRTLHSLNQKGEPEGLDCFIFSNTPRVYFTNTITGKFHMRFLSFTTGMR